MPSPRIIPTLATLLLAGTLTGCQAYSTKNAADPLAELARLRSEANRVAERGYLAQQSGDLVRAEELYQESLQLDPSLAATWNNLGQIRLSQKSYLDAVEAFSEASFLAPSHPDPEYNIGIAYDEAGYAKDALKHYGRALARDPRHTDSLRGAVRAAALLGEADLEIEGWIRTALLTEQEPRWREFFNEQRFRVEAALQAERTAD